MLKYASISKPGNRKCNEDYIQISSVSNRHCFVICDGLGGHGMGDIAAQIAGETFADILYSCEGVSDYMDRAFIEAQNKIMKHQMECNACNKMKTTAVCMLTDEDCAYIGHIGDSRFYAFSKNDTYIRTFDHSVPQLLVEAKTINESQIRNHPNRNMLLKVMGCKWDEPLYEIESKISLKDYQAFLLCSDGFWELIKENEMMSTLSESHAPEEWLSKMTAIVEHVGRGKEMDNYSAIAIFNDP